MCCAVCFSVSRYGQIWTAQLCLNYLKVKLIKEGLNQIVNIKPAFLKGLRKFVKETFPNTQAFPLLNYNPNLSNLNYYWLAGFINTDDSFFLTHSRIRLYKLLILLKKKTSYSKSAGGKFTTSNWRIINGTNQKKILNN